MPWLVNDMETGALTGLDLRLGGEPWNFASEQRERIAAHWRGLTARRPRLWNGEVLICLAADVRDGVLSGRFARTDYASFLAWRDWGTPDTTACNMFGTPVVLTADRAMIFAEMAVHTQNGGMIYPPSGSLEPRDITPDGTVDLLGSIAIELREETGLDVDAASPGAMLAIRDAHRLAVVQVLHFAMTADEILQAFAVHHDPSAELSRLVVIRGAGDTDPRMPRYAQEIVRRYDQWFGDHHET
jgi:8-oxo-dGTP pyrophosphatase MutT (NUDIX family)